MANADRRGTDVNILEHDTVFDIAGVGVTETVVATWALVGVLAVVGVVAGRRVQEEPSGWQSVVEWGFTWLRGFVAQMTGSDGALYVPLVATVGLFILAANTMSVIPFVKAPTADLNTPLALAVIVFFSVHYFGARRLGVRRYARSFAQPSIILLPMNILSNLTRTFSLAIRLFGNMLSHEVIVAVLLLVLPLVLPAVLEVFGLFIGVLQAYIFTILTAVYIGGAVRGEAA